MKGQTLGGIAGVVIVLYYLLWRVSVFRDMFRRSGKMLRHLRESKS